MTLSIIVWALRTEIGKDTEGCSVFVYCWAAAGMQKGALQFRLEEAELRWLTKLFRPHRDPHSAMGRWG